MVFHFLGLLSLPDECLLKIFDILDYGSLKNVNECCKRLYQLTGDSYRRRDDGILFFTYNNNVMSMNGSPHAKRFRRFCNRVAISTHQRTLSANSDFAAFVSKNCGTPKELYFKSTQYDMFDHDFGNRIASNLAKVEEIYFNCHENLNRSIYPFFKQTVLQNSNLVNKLKDKSGILPTVSLTRLDSVSLFILNEQMWVSTKLRLNQFLTANRGRQMKVILNFMNRPSDEAIDVMIRSIYSPQVEVVVN